MKSTNKESLTIVQMNDTHAYFDIHQEMFWQGNHAEYRLAGGFARIATIVKQIRAESEGNCLFCDSGDTLHGTYPALATQGKAMIPVLNAMEIDAMSAHWEFAFDPTTFNKRVAELNYPMLAINIYKKSTKKLVYPPYFIKEIGGVKIGLIGIASNIVDKTMPPSFSVGIYFTLGKDELPPIIDLLRNTKKVDLIVLISHLGFTQDMKLLSEVQGVDVCLSGHTHNRLYKPVLNGKTIVIQSGCHGSFLGRLDLEILDGQITDYQHQLIEVEASVKPDPVVAELVKQALAPYKNDFYNIIPGNPPVSTIEISGEELREMLEENLERTFSCDAYHQMGGYIKRCLGLNVYFKIENPAGLRIQELFVGDEKVQSDKYYSAAFVTMQGVPPKYGRNRENQPEQIIDAMRKYLTKHRPVRAELRGTFVAV